MPVSGSDLRDLEQDANTWLSAIRGLCASIKRAGRLLDQGANSKSFERSVLSEWRTLSRLTNPANCREERFGNAQETIRLAVANELQPIRFQDETAMTAHEAAYMVGHLIEYDCGPVFDWDEIASESGKPYPESERQGDCRRLVRKVAEVTPELLLELEWRIEAERIKAERWLLDRPAAVAARLIGQVAQDSGRKGRQRISREEANIRAREALKNPRLRSARKLAKAIGCSVGQVPKLSAWRAYQQRVERQGKRETPGPKAVSMSDAVLANEGRDDAELERLIAEYQENFEESPLVSHARKQRRRRPKA